MEGGETLKLAIVLSWPFSRGVQGCVDSLPAPKGNKYPCSWTGSVGLFPESSLVPWVSSTRVAYKLWAQAPLPSIILQWQ